MATYLVHGFRLSDRSNNSKCSILVDHEPRGDYGASTVAEQIVGDSDICFHMSMNVSDNVPDAAKNILFWSDADLYAAAPALAPPPKHPRRFPRPAWAC